MSSEVQGLGRQQSAKEATGTSETSTKEAQPREPSCRKARDTTQQVTSLRQRIGRQRRGERRSDLGRQLRRGGEVITRQRERGARHPDRSEKVSEWTGTNEAKAKLYALPSRGDESAN